MEKKITPNTHRVLFVGNSTDEGGPIFGEVKEIMERIGKFSFNVEHAFTLGHATRAIFNPQDDRYHIIVIDECFKGIALIRSIVINLKGPLRATFFNSKEPKSRQELLERVTNWQPFF